MNSFIRLEHISKTYKLGETAFHALRNISVSFESGTFCFVTGRSGSGKTTLLNLIGTLDKPTKGKIFLEGKDISILPDKSLSELRRRRIGFVFQAFNLLNEYSVWDNVCLSFYLDGAKPDRTYLEELLNTFGLWERRDSAVWRPAAAGRHCPGNGESPCNFAGRRAHGESRSSLRFRSHADASLVKGAVSANDSPCYPRCRIHRPGGPKNPYRGWPHCGRYPKC